MGERGDMNLGGTLFVSLLVVDLATPASIGAGWYVLAFGLWLFGSHRWDK